MIDAAWSATVRFAEVGREPLVRHLAPDAATRARMAAGLDLFALPDLQASVTTRAWLDGVALVGRWSARVVQTCGVTLEPFESTLSGEFEVRVVPTGSPNAPREGGEIAIDPEAADPPDVVEDDRVDLAAYVVEHLALAIDPYSRKPGAVFEPSAPRPEGSPFDVLGALPLRKGDREP